MYGWIGGNCGKPQKYRNFDSIRNTISVESGGKARVLVVICSEMGELANGEGAGLVGLLQATKGMRRKEGWAGS